MHFRPFGHGLSRQAGRGAAAGIRRGILRASRKF